MNRKTGTTVAIVMLAAVAFGGVLRAQVIDQVLVKVNGDILTKTDLEARQVQAVRQLNRSGRPTDQQLRDMLNEVTPRLIVNFVDETLLVQRAKELGYKLTDEQFKTAVDNIRKDNKIETDEQFNAALKQEGMTLAELRSALERQRLAFLVRQNEVMQRLSVSDEETRRYYDSHPGEFSTSPSVTLREILIAIPADSSEEAAKKKADDVRRRGTTGEDFAVLAAEVSDSPSKANAGLVGPISFADLSPEIRTALEGLKAGDVSPVIKGSAGFQILKIETLTEKETLPYDKARNQISEQVYQRKAQEEFLKYLEKLRTQAIIEWKSPELQKAYEQGLKQGIVPEA